MKKITMLLFGMALCFALASIANSSSSGSHEGSFMNEGGKDTKIRIVFNNQEVIVALFDNTVSRDFASLLPMSVTFKDYAGIEKIAYLSRKLTAQGGASSRDVQGDFTYYAPWGNLAVFYKGFGNDSGLRILGRIEFGKEKLANMNSDFNARIELVE